MTREQSLRLKSYVWAIVAWVLFVSTRPLDVPDKKHWWIPIALAAFLAVVYRLEARSARRSHNPDRRY